MFLKLAAAVVSMGAIACALLALRQERLQMASELAQAQLRIQQKDAELWRLRARVAARVSPREVEELAAGLDALRPMIAQGFEVGPQVPGTTAKDGAGVEVAEGTGR